MSSKLAWRGGVVLALFLLLCVFFSGAQVPGQTDKKGTDTKRAEGPKDDREADRKGIKLATESFIKAFQSGDAKAVAAHWTSEGELMDDDGTTLRGRAAIEKSYAEFFTKNTKIKAEVEVESLRFLSRDTAVEEGYFKVTKGKAAEVTTSRYTVLHVRENGVWMMAVVREWPNEGSTLRDVDWLIGTWEAKADDTVVRTTYEWDENRTFIRARFSVTDKAGAVSGMQMIGRDAAAGTLRSWVFESKGGFGEAIWARDGKKWVLQASGVSPDGSILSATNIITPLGPDAFVWQSTNRTSDGDDLPAVPPIRVNRVKAK